MLQSTRQALLHQAQRNLPHITSASLLTLSGSCTLASSAASFRPRSQTLKRRAHSPQPHLHSSHSCRSFASKSSGGAMNVFDRDMKHAQWRNAALAPNYAYYHYMRDEVAARVVDRLGDINKAFPVVVEIGCGTGAHVSKLLTQIVPPTTASTTSASSSSSTSSTPTDPLSSTSVANRGQINTLHICDSSPEVLSRTREYWTSHANDIPANRKHEYHVMNEEGAFPFAPGSVDLIVSNMSMHWVNDLPGFLRRCRTALKPDGVFLASMLGGSTLQELRSALTVADMERLGGINAHVSPFAYGRDCGDLMSSAGFSMPTIDTDVLTIRYPDLFTLMDHLQGMGESNCVHQRAPSVSRDIFLSAAATYESLYADEEGLLPATFQIFYMIGWAPHVSQPKPLERGTATAKLGDLEKIAEEQAAKFEQ